MVHICCVFSIVHWCYRPGNSVTIMLSRWHNLSMQTVENQPDMKPWTLGPIPLLNHSAWSGGSKASSTLSALSRLCSAYEPLTTGLGQGYNPHCRPQEIFFETYHLNIHRGKVLGYKTLHCTVAYYEVVMVFGCWIEHLPSMDISDAGDILNTSVTMGQFW